ncbi:MAG: PspC domain-containing protein [Coriobacteriales bacterium]|jgi:phage shock protein PspC (stress-responsive transcriptional regulator)|nr:PspC domain-containing protein [Coriobacteriales bacterium]
MGNSKWNKNSIAVIAGVMLVLFGIWQLAQILFGNWFGEIWRVITTVLNILWPLVLVAAGVALVVAAQKGKLELPSNKKLFRSTRNKKIAGVCGGLAAYFSIDPLVVRVIFLILIVLVWFVIVPLYLLFWVIIPPDTKNYGTWV